MATHFEAQIEIEASTSVVWDILTDLKRYGEWSSFCPKVESTLEPGAPIVLHAQMNKYLRYPQKCFIRVVEPEAKLCWNASVGFKALMFAERWQVIEPLGPNRCRYSTRERFQGLLAPVIGATFGGGVQRGFERTAQELKARAEAFAKAA